MNKAQAIEKMEQGVKMTHNSFTPKEWITIKDGMIWTEDGYSIPGAQFWVDRLGTQFLEGWKPFDAIDSDNREKDQIKDHLIDSLKYSLKGVLNIVKDSQGVSGYHRNGRVAQWDEFDEIIEAEALIKRIEG